MGYGSLALIRSMRAQHLERIPLRFEHSLHGERSSCTLSPRNRQRSVRSGAIDAEWCARRPCAGQPSFLLMASSIGLRSGDTVDPVDWNIVHDHDIAAPERGSETLLHVSEEHWPVHRALDNERRDHCKYFLSSVNRSSWYPWPTLARSEPTRTDSAGGQFKSPEPPARGSSRRPCHWHRCR